MNKRDSRPLVVFLVVQFLTVGFGARSIAVVGQNIRMSEKNGGGRGPAEVFRRQSGGDWHSGSVANPSLPSKDGSSLRAHGRAAKGIDET